jgi:hypothetical protein
MACFGVVNTGISLVKETGSVTFFYEIATDFNDSGVVQPTDFNDANTMVWSKQFRGTLYDVEIDVNTTDTDLVIGIYCDPPEPPALAQVEKLYEIATFAITDTNDKLYAVPVSDISQNIYSGPHVMGKIWIGIKNTTHSLTDNVKVYLYGKID